MDSAQNTPLHLACSHGHDEVVSALMFNRQPKCKINAVNDEGNTPLHNAARWGFCEWMWCVLAHSAASGYPEVFLISSD